MGSDDVQELAVLGGTPAHEQLEDEGSAQDAARDLVPFDTTWEVFDFSRRLIRGFERVHGSAYLGKLDKLIRFMTFLFTSGLPFRLDVAWPDGPSEGVEVNLHYVSTDWEDLPPEAVVRLLAIELGLDPDEVPPGGSLRIPAAYTKRQGALRIVELALHKLGRAHENEARRAELIGWASRLRGVTETEA